MKKFYLKEMVFISLIVATIFVLGYTLLPFMQLMPLPAFKAIVLAPVYGGGVTLAVYKIRKIGVVTFLALVMGGFLSSFSIWMFPITLLGGILTDFICFTIFKGYRNPKSISFAGGFFPGIQLPLALFILIYVLGWFSSSLLKNPFIIFLPSLLTFFLGYITSLALQKILIKRNL